MSRPVIAICSGSGFPGETYRRTSHLAFRKPALLCYLLHYMTVSIAGGKTHPAIDSGRVCSQGLLDGAHLFDEFAPVHGGEEAQAPDAVAHGKLVGRLLLVLRLDQLLDRQVRPGELLLDPGKGERKGAPCPWRRRVNSATKELTIGGFDLAMSATVRIRLFGSFSAVSVILSAQ